MAASITMGETSNQLQVAGRPQNHKSTITNKKYLYDLYARNQSHTV